MAEVSIVTRTQLKELLDTVRPKYQPLPWRLWLQESKEVPPYARQGQVIRIDSSASMKQISSFDNSLPLANVKRADMSFDIIELANAFQVSALDSARAEAEPGFKLGDTHALANQRAAEAAISEVVMLGSYQGTSVGNVNGLLKMPDATTITATDDWVNLAGDVVVTDVAAIVSTITSAIYSYTVIAGDEVTPDYCLIPQYQAKALVQISGTLGKSPTEILKAAVPGTQFFVSRQANLASTTANTDRFCIFSRDPQVARAVVPKPYDFFDAIQINSRGDVEVEGSLRTGGCVSSYPLGIVYVDMTRG